MLDGKGGTVLVVEDDAGVARLQRNALQRAGYTVATAETGAEALDEINRRPVEIVLLDYRLSDGLTGLDVYAQLRANGHKLPVIIVTGLSDEVTVIQALRAGVRDFVNKSAAYLDYLPEAVDRVLKQERTERRLNESQALLGDVIGSAMDGILTADEEQRITLFNPAAERMFRCPAAEAIGRPIGTFLGFQDMPFDCRRFQIEAQAATADSRLELHGLRADGGQLPLEASIAAGEASGHKFFTVVLRDITERKRAAEALRNTEEHLRQKQKLEAIGSLAGGVAHEFNNLLQAILGYTQFAMDGLPAGERRYEDLEQVLKAANRASALTRQLLAFGRRQVLKRTSVHPNEVVTDLVKMLRPLIGEGIELCTMLDDGVGTIHADADELLQALLNLCINARDAMSQGGRLTIRTQDVYLGESHCAAHPDVKPGRHLLLSVSDTGCGMSPEVQEHIFEPFYTTKEVGAGTGLGLAMVYGMIQQHQGAIQVYSEPGAGATFRLYLRAIDAEAAVGAPARAERGPGGNETILIAEDEPMVRQMVVRILEGAGYRTIAAQDGEDGLRAFVENSALISLVVLDLVMPKMGGYQLYHHLKVLHPGLRVVFCSGHDPQKNEAQMIAQEGLPLIEKPFNPDVLLKAVRRVLDEPRRRRAESRGPEFAVPGPSIPGAAASSAAAIMT
jgi:two-component system cell cycle sensor histidine kinase/response regulator CckA